MRAYLTLLCAIGLAALAAGCPSRGIPTYDPCQPTQRCEGDRDRCVEIVYPGPSGEGVASMCTTQNCVTDADCPLDVRGRSGVCLAFDGAPSTCFERCERAGDCALGWSCQTLAPVGGADADVCVPDA